MTNSAHAGARARVKRVQLVILVAGLLAALAWSVSAAVLTLVAGYALRSIVDVQLGNASWITAAALAGMAALALMMRRVWAARDSGRVALWVEEQRPELRFALVTAVDPTYQHSPELERASAFRPPAVLRAPLTRLLLPAAVAALISLALLVVVANVAPVSAPGGGLIRDLADGPRAGSNPLEGIRAVINPPAYTRAQARRVADPSTISALRGSGITVSGRGDGVSASLGGRAVPVSRGWSFRFAMPERSAALTLTHGGARRVIVLESLRDPAPVVRLQRPERDTTVRAASGTIAIRALAEDDHGIADASLEYLISSGAEETFTARTGVLRSVRSAGRRLEMEATLPLDPLRLAPGDLVSIRAVARDGNTVSGPGIGASETRTYRVARRDEFDSLAIEAGAPIVAESSLVSQRMLILRTEAVVREQPALVADTFRTRVRGIAFDQERLRERVHDLIYPGHTHPEGALLPEGEPEDQAENAGPINPDLKTAYDEMWSASRELRIEQPAASLPFMRLAAAALDRARLSNRLYLRSGTPRVIVDVPRVRLQGKERGGSSTREPARPGRPDRARVAREFAAAVGRARRDRAGAANDLALLRGSVLDGMPRFAASLQPLVEALRRGRPGDVEIRTARLELEQFRERSTVGAWSRW